MTELLTAKDVEVKMFKKARFGGYSVPEVEDFLNQVADDLEAYTMQLDEKDNRIQELEEFVSKHEAMTDEIKDALIQARKAAKDMEEQAQAEKDKIIADAQAEAERIVSEAGAQVQAKLDEAEQKAAGIIADARSSAGELLQASKDKRAKAEQSYATLEQEVEARRQEAESEAQGILASARAEARKLLADTKQEASDYQEPIQFLNLKKQQFLKDTVSLLLDFGKFIDRAQDDVNAEISSSSSHAPTPAPAEPEPQPESLDEGRQE